MTAHSAAGYNLVDYPSGPIPQAHPNRLATAAKLFGMNPPPVDSCRVLELGCGDGGHLIPCAVMLPHTTFVGVDLAETAIERGQHNAQQLNLSNITFQCADLAKFQADEESFDYILLHGVYSWVPSPVRDRCLELCRSLLSPNGVAYVSYNCYPGCHTRRMTWEMLRYHTRDIHEPRPKIQQAQAFAKALLEGVSKADGYRDILKGELDEIVHRKHPDLLYHDDLSDVNAPVYFHEFAAHAEKHELQYLAEADFSEMQTQQFPPPIRGMLEQLEKHDIVQKEQYLDFFKGTRFRRTLLCRREQSLDRTIHPQQAREFRIQSALKPAAQPNLAPGVTQEFQTPGGPPLQLDHALSKAAFVCLSEIWPQSLPFDELVSRSWKRLETANATPDSNRDEEILCEVLTAALQAGPVRWLAYQDEWPFPVGDKPKVNPLNQLELERRSIMVTTRDLTVLHVENVFDRQVLLLADGNATQAEIVREMEQLVQQQPALFPNATADDIRNGVERALATAARFGLLVK